MTLQDAITGAKQAAKDSEMTIAVIHAPIENAEDETGPYGYCPVMAKNILYRWGTIERLVKPDQTVCLV